MKTFIVTVDTEEDNLWHWKKGDPIKTNNVNFIPRFQELCEKYSFDSMYLKNMK